MYVFILFLFYYFLYKLFGKEGKGKLILLFINQ